MALYARVSTDGQQKEGTIESQLAELRKQVTAAGHELVKEYIDDGYSGSLLDRPALDQLRAGLKFDLFDAIYFLSPDRIAREVNPVLVPDRVGDLRLRTAVGEKVLKSGDEFVRPRG